MDHQAELPSSLRSALEMGEAVVTGNERAARTLRQRFDRFNQAAGRNTWQPPDILSWDAWTVSLWRQMLITGSASQMLLNRSQEHALWLSILRNDTSLNTLRSIDSLAQLAADALRLTCSFNGERDLQQAAGGSDARSFRRWAFEFDRICLATACLPKARIEQRLAAAVTSAQQFLPRVLHLVGFDSRTPSQSLLLDAARSVGMACLETPISTPSDEALLVAAKDDSDEILTAARWARNLIERQPDARIAIIAPELEIDNQRWTIGHIFHRVLAPHSNRIDADLPPAFEFSLGSPLARTPIVSTALDLLRWALGALPCEQVSSLLLSHYFSDDANDRSKRAEFDASLVRQIHRLRPEITIEEVQRLLAGSRAVKYSLPRLQASLRSMRLHQAKTFATPLQQTFDTWAEVIRNYLADAGWKTPGDQSSLEFQARRKWESALDELSTLSFRGELVTFAEALQNLARIAAETTFAPESHHAPVQIMGALEAAGSTFDAIWFLGATDLAWPPPLSANPLLPRSMQQSLGMPGADKQRDLDFARRVTARIVASSASVVFSYAREGPDGSQRPSALLQGLTSPQVLAESILPHEPEPASVPLETVLDTTPIPPPQPLVQGGARVLELQAACGFRAFAELRLASSELRGASLGMDAGERGSLVHKALELFWQRIPSQSALRAMSFEERDSLLQQCIQAPLDKVLRLATGPWELAYLESQRGRLTALLHQWLEFELSRPPFEIVERERSLRASCGPLLLDIRLDRVDKLADRSLLIDYKTGPASRSDWYSRNPDAPQLPLYAIASPIDDLGGIAFAHVRPGDGTAITGVAGFPNILGKQMEVPEKEFAAQLEDWRTVLTALAEAFYQGDAAVQPKQFPKTCSRCGQRLLCRLDPRTMDQPMENDDASTFEEDHE